MDTWIWKLPKGILTTKSAKDFRKGHKERIRYISLFVNFVHTFVSLVVKFYFFDATPFEHRNDYTLINILTTKVARGFRKGRKGYIFWVLTLRSLRIPSCSLRLNFSSLIQPPLNIENLTTKNAKYFHKGHKERMRYISLFVNFVLAFVSLVVKFYFLETTSNKYWNDYILINILTAKDAREFRKGHKRYTFSVLTLRS